MKSRLLRIGTRDSQLALWQATMVQRLLRQQKVESELVPVKSEGDLDLVTPLYAMGVEGVFTKTLDAYLLSNKIDIAVHSMKDVPTQLAAGIRQAAVFKRANPRDLLLYKEDAFSQAFASGKASDLSGSVATGSVRRKAQILHRFAELKIENLRGNVQTRMEKLRTHSWNGAIFAAAGLERIDQRPQQSLEIEWMLPAPAQGAVVAVCRSADAACYEELAPLNDLITALCVKIERDFLSGLMGGCSTPISAWAQIEGDQVCLKGNILSTDGREIFETKETSTIENAENLGSRAAEGLLARGADRLVEALQNNESK